jgi:hypothetical protein
VALQLGLAGGGQLFVQHLATSTPGIDGQWLLSGSDWELQWRAGYDPCVSGWRLGAVHARERETSYELLGEIGPRPGCPEPWAEAHAEIAKAVVRAVRGARSSELASFGEGALLQRLFAMALQSDEEGRRVFSAASSVASGAPTHRH